MRLTMYSFTASMLYLSFAEIGTMGDDSSTVPMRHQVSQCMVHNIRSTRTFYEKCSFGDLTLAPL